MPSSCWPKRTGGCTRRNRPARRKQPRCLRFPARIWLWPAETAKASATMATKPNGRTLARKLAGPVSSFAVTVLAGGFLTATMVRFSPGFAADEQLLDTRLNEASRNAMRMRHEAEADMPRFYVRHLVNMLRGDLGFSYSMQRPVAELLADRLPVTARLIAMGMAGAWLLGLTLAAAGVLFATRLGGGNAN